MRFRFDKCFGFAAGVPCVCFASGNAPGPGSRMFMATPGGYPPPSDPGYPPPSGPGYVPPPPPPGYVPPPQGQPGAGMSVNTASVLCYLFGFISGVIFLVLEPYRRDRVVRFHAFQSIFFNLAVIVLAFGWNILGGILSVATHGIFIPVHLVVSGLLSIAFLIVWIVLMVRAGQGQRWVLPLIGPFAERQANAG